MSPAWWCRKPATWTRRPDVGWIPPLWPPGSTGWGRGGPRPVPARTPTQPTRTATCSAAGPNAGTAGVGLRPAPDTMAVLTGYLPVEQGVACLAALRRHTDTVKADGDPRSRDPIMADTLVERLTGQAAAADVNIELHLLMPLTSLLDPHDATPAEIAGYGPIPAGTAHDLLRSSRGRRWWRRLFTAPAGGPIIAADRFRRRFNSSLGTLIRLRDRTCRDPYCDAPIRHLDHVHRHADGGPSTLANGRGLCARGNYVREMPGWTATVTNDGRHSHPHTVTSPPPPATPTPAAHPNRPNARRSVHDRGGSPIPLYFPSAVVAPP